LLSRPRVRLGLLVVGVAALIVVAVSVHLADVIAARDAAQQQAEQQRPLVAALAARRADLKEVAPWFDQRPSMSPALHVLAQALPALESAEQVRLVRVRQIAGEEVVAEGAAGDRAQMMSFLLRVRQDPRVRSAEIRSSRSPAKESKAVVFEIVLHLGARDAVASAAEKGGDNASS
jgi:hypothetical protein